MFARGFAIKVLRKFHGGLGRILEEKSLINKVITLKPEKTPRGHVLISWNAKAFLVPSGPSVSYFHHSPLMAQKMARTFLDIGYSVDFIDKRNRKFIPKKEYAFFIDTRMNLKRLTPLLNKDCVKIYYITSANAHFNNSAEARRILDLQKRKHVTLQARRFMDSQYETAIEYADCVMVRSELSASEFRFAHKPIYRVPNAVPYVYPWPDTKDFEVCRRRFLWLGSKGMIHKGLDLVLEAFSEMPEYHLTVCGPVEKEEDFKKAFFKELYQTPNIHTYGWIDVQSSKFMEIVNTCLGHVFPSCAECVPGVVLNCLHSGLIPIVSYETGVEVSDDFGVILRDASIAEIKNAVQRVSSLPTRELKQMARKAWEFARANHTMEKFEEEFRKMIENLIADFKSKA